MSEPAHGGDDPPAADQVSRGAGIRGAAARLRRHLHATGVITARGGPSMPAAIAIGVILVSLLLFLHVAAQDSGVRRHSDVLAQLAAVKLIDARWDVAVLRARSDPRAPSESVVQSPDVARVQRALDAALAQARSAVLRSSIAGLKNGYAEKAQLIARYLQASADSRQALAAAMRADPTVSGLVRTAWRDFPQRERLVAAENLVTRVLAEAQQYHHAPSPAHRSALQSAAADLPSAHSLPAGIAAGLARLESDIHQMLLLKPLEQTLGERLTVLDTGARADALADTFQRELAEATARRSGYRSALMVYSTLLLLLVLWTGRRHYLRYRALEALYSAQVETVAQLVDSARWPDAIEPPDAAAAQDARAANVTFIRRPGPNP